MSFQIRSATTADLPILNQLIGSSVRGLSAGYYSTQQIESALVYVLGVDTQLIADGTYFAIEEGAEIVGCGGWGQRRTLYGGDQRKDGADNLLDPQTEAARIRAFFVHPAHARRGIGRRLLEHCEAAARNAGFTTLELGATLPGVPLYEAFGFVAIERLDEPMPDGVTLPIVRMRKRL